MISLFCLVFYVSYLTNSWEIAGETGREGQLARECECKLSSINLKVNLTSLSCMDAEAKCRQTNRLACTCTPTLTPTQKMSLRDLVCSAAVGSLLSVGLIASSSPTELGSALNNKVSLSVTRLTWHLTPLSRQRPWHLHLDTVADLQGKAKSGDICDS